MVFFIAVWKGKMFFFIAVWKGKENILLLLCLHLISDVILLQTLLVLYFSFGLA